MLGTIAALYSYKTAPKTAFYMRHPVRALEARRAWASLTGPTAQNVAIGIGAAAVALPLGFWLGRKAMEG